MSYRRYIFYALNKASESGGNTGGETYPDNATVSVGDNKVVENFEPGGQTFEKSIENSSLSNSKDYLEVVTDLSNITEESTSSSAGSDYFFTLSTESEDALSNPAMTDSIMFDFTPSNKTLEVIIYKSGSYYTATFSTVLSNMALTIKISKSGIYINGSEISFSNTRSKNVYNNFKNKLAAATKLYYGAKYFGTGTNTKYAYINYHKA